jgi:predicted NAD-dependent protein-ADP-ribosyltransferase YbiA (DUF1768 family)
MRVRVFILFFFCLQASANHPDHWWQKAMLPIPSWEITPEKADRSKNEVILSKRNELGVFSNFTKAPFEFQGIKYESVEGFWQMTKFPDPMLKDDPRVNHPLFKKTRSEVSQMIAFKAKEQGDIGKKVMQELNINWVSYRGKKYRYREMKKGPFYQLIRKVMRAKLDQNPKIKKLLLKTKGLTLLPDHIQEKNAPFAWRYNEIWMEIRGELEARP